ncbi:MAG: carboxypeptidase regulatory-like domain-containing protein, partial [Planctomycetaceae bacterium]|nr:carboxypeptidase regulatory-like domain-containing protein [Planctomycetaceae bacterium]
MLPVLRLFPFERLFSTPSRTLGRRLRKSSPEIAAIETLEDRLLLTVVMSEYEQLLLELVNRTRQDPQAEAARQGVSVPETGYRAPLAPHQLLINAAGAYSQRMLDQDFFSHTDPDGNGPFVRVSRTGYPAFIVSENIAWQGTTGSFDPTDYTFQLHHNLFLSDGHRAGMLDTRTREIGVGIRGGQFIDPRNGQAYNALMATELFASRSSSNFITGVAFTDHIVDDAFFTVGEQLGNVVVTARNQSTGATFSTTTGPSGGYSLEVPNGVYTVTFSGGGLSSPSAQPNISVNGANQKVDFDQSNQRAATLPRNFIVVGADAGGGPHVRVLDAQTGFEWLSIFPYSSAFTGGVRVATGDVNGDGVLDIITSPGRGGGPHIKVFDGRSGGEIANFMAYDPRFTGGAFVAAADVNG